MLVRDERQIVRLVLAGDEAHAPVAPEPILETHVLDENPLHPATSSVSNNGYRPFSSIVPPFPRNRLPFAGGAVFRHLA